MSRRAWLAILSALFFVALVGPGAAVTRNPDIYVRDEQCTKARSVSFFVCNVRDARAQPIELPAAGVIRVGDNIAVSDCTVGLEKSKRCITARDGAGRLVKCAEVNIGWVLLADILCITRQGRHIAITWRVNFVVNNRYSYVGRRRVANVVILNVNLKWLTNCWILGEGLSTWCNPRSIGVNRGLISVNNADVDEYQSNKANNGSPSGNGVKPNGYPDLPFPEAPLCGVVFFSLGLLLAITGIKRGPTAILVVGWILEVVGGGVIVLWLIPIAASIFPI